MDRNSGASRVTEDPAVKRLVIAVLAGFVLVLTAGAYLVYFAITHQGLPQTVTDRAVRDQELAYREDPADPVKGAAYARVLIETGRLDQAERVLARYRGTETTEAKAAVAVQEIRLLLARGDAEAALDAVKGAKSAVEALRTLRREQLRSRGISFEPGMPEQVELGLLWADAAEKSSKLEAAVEALTWVLEEDGTAADVLTRRGELLVRLGKKDQARADFEKALKMLPDYEPAKKGLESLDG